MSRTRIYHPHPLREATETTLEEGPSRHLLRVLRLRPGADLVLFDGAGTEHAARLVGGGRRASVWIGPPLRREPESPLEVTLVQGISRGERMDQTLRKSVELGVHRIVPVFAARTQVRLAGERLARRQGHWEGIVVAACEQSGRTRVPALLPAIDLDAWFAHPAPEHERRLMLDPAAERGPAALPRPTGAVALLVGPEGGLDDAERAAARRAGFEGMRLGPRILRTETAGPAALAAIQTLWGDLG